MPKKIQYIYNLGLRYPNEKTKTFNIEHDTIITQRKFKQEDVKEISNNLKCDVKMTYLGVLTPQTEKKPLEIENKYYTKEDIQKYIDKWNKGEKNGTTKKKA